MARSKSKQTRRKILIVDDHPIVRHGLAQLIAQTPDLAVCAEAGNVSEALKQVKATAPDVAVIDISLESENGIQLIQQIKAKHPRVKMLVSSIHDETIFAPRALQAGAKGYIHKREAIRKIIQAEDPRKPLSESKIVSILQREGLMLARRTIAKYREELKIPTSNQRKVLY